MCITWYYSDIADIKRDIYDILTQPIAIGISDDEDANNAKPNMNIDQIVENACNRVSVELTDQLWDLLKGLTDDFYGIYQTKLKSYQMHFFYLNFSLSII